MSKPFQTDSVQSRKLEQIRLALLSGVVLRKGGGDEHRGLTFGFSASLLWDKEQDVFIYSLVEEETYAGQSKQKKYKNFLLWDDIILGLLGGTIPHLDGDVFFYLRLEECLTQLNEE